MTDDQIAPGCRAQFRLNDGGPWLCVLSENHAGPHLDGDGDTWDLTYVDEPGVSQQAIPFHLTVRPVQGQLTALTTRVGLLEASRTYLAPEDEREGNYLHGRTHDDLIKELYQRISKLEGAWTVGGETLEERLARNVLGMQERHRSVVGDVGELRKLFLALREDATRLHTRITGLEKDRDATDKRVSALEKFTRLTDQSDSGAVLIGPVELGKLEAEAADHVCGPAC